MFLTRSEYDRGVNTFRCARQRGSRGATPARARRGLDVRQHSLQQESAGLITDFRTLSAALRAGSSKWSMR